MKFRMPGSFVTFTVLTFLNWQVTSCLAFEGRITAALTRAGNVETWQYTVGTNQLRIERTETNWPYARDIVSLDTGDVIILFPHNRSFVRLKPAADNAADMSGIPGMNPPPGGLPPGMGAQPPPGLPPHTAIGPTNLPGMPAPPAMPSRPAGPAGAQMPPGVGPQAGMAGGMPSMPMMPPMPMERLELKATTDTTNLLGYACVRYEIKQRNEVMEIWATDKLMTFQPYLQNQPHHFGPHMLEEQWGGMLEAKKLFPLLAVLKFQNGAERFRFDVISIQPQSIEDKDGSVFEPPPDYQEIQPLPF